jgi:tetratricopeptide (TPR) repeat protein
MSDPLRTDAARDAGDAATADRDERIEQLLVAGLDHYFAGDFEHAINVWSRVVFLDRQHSRARAYIERARSALAERHRESEELLHRGVDAFNRGDTGEARTLINQAVEHVGPNDMAFVFLERLNRLAPAASGPDAPGRRVKSILPSSATVRRVVIEPKTRRTLWLGVGVAAVAAAAALLLAGAGLGMWFADRPSGRVDVIAPAAAPLPVARASETAIARARQLNAEGNPREALRVLESVTDADPLRGAADALQAEIQRRILDDVALGARP